MHYALDTSSPTEIRASISASAAEVDEAIRESGQDARLLLADRLAREVMEKEDISPVSHPMYEGGDLKPGSAYDFTARLAVLPPIELPDCSSLEVRLPEPGLEQEELRGVYLAMLRQFATVEEVSDGRPAKSGDIAVVDIEALAGGEKVPGMQGSDLPVRLDDSGGRLKEVRALAEGLRVGETANGTMSCSEEFPVESYRGKEVSLKVTLKELRCEKLPTLDEGFAKKLGFGSLRELETKVLKDAMGSKMAFIKARAGEELLNGILDKTDFPVPEPVRELFVRDEVLGGRDAMLRQGVPQEEISRRINAALPDIRVRADRHARAHCFLLALASREGLQVPEKEMEDVIARMAGKDRDPAELRKAMEKNGTFSDVHERLLAARAMEFLYSHAKKIVVDRNGDPVQPPQGA